MKQMWLKKKADKAVRRFHPWVFSGAVDRLEGGPGTGDLLRVLDAEGSFLAWGHYNPNSRIRVRLLDWREDAEVDGTWLRERLAAALELRRSMGLFKPGGACRLVFSEADYLPGLVADWFAGWVVLQAMTSGAEIWKAEAASILMELTGARGVYERSDAESRRLEGLESATGTLAGETPPAAVEFTEGGYRFLADLAGGQKTGFFLDQRVNRARVASYAAGRDVLDCFCYTGGFSVYAAGAGASSVTRIDSSAAAVEIAARNLELNGLGGIPGEAIQGDVFHVLRDMRNRGASFDLIVLDPPKFAPTRAQVSAASRAYKDINLLAMKLLRPGGVLATFSCSQGVEADLFQKIVFGATLDSGREVQILEHLSQGQDHPVRMSFPESSYLKGLIGWVL